MTTLRTNHRYLAWLLILLLTLVPLVGCQGQKQEAKVEEEQYQLVETAGKLKAHFIDVGQGDAILIQAPQKNILIDGGEKDSSVAEYLKAQGINKLDLLVGTHPHSDHIGGLIEVLKEITVVEVLDPGVNQTSKTFEEYLTLIDQKDIKFTEGRAGMTRDLGNGVVMKVLHPTKPSAKELNDASIVIKLSFDQINFLFTGDAESGSEKEILAKNPDSLESQILKVGHHGSSSSTMTKFLKAVNPKVAIITVGRDNSYGHPHKETLSKLNKAGVKLYRTDIHKDIIVTTDGKTFEVVTKAR